MNADIRAKLKEIISALWEDTNIFNGTTSYNIVFPDEANGQHTYFVYCKLCSHLDRENDAQMEGSQIFADHDVEKNYNNHEMEFVTSIFVDGVVVRNQKTNVLALDFDSIKDASDFKSQFYGKLFSLVSTIVPPPEIPNLAREAQANRDELEKVISELGVNKPSRNRATRVLTALRILTEDLGYGAGTEAVDQIENLILFGPPGTGKTRLAKRIACNRVNVEPSKWNDQKHLFYERVKVMQFHPSTSYEDFVEGIKPVTDHFGDVKYEVMPGPCLVMIAKATQRFLSVPGYKCGTKFYPAPTSLKHFDLEDASNIECSAAGIEIMTSPPTEGKEQMRWDRLQLRSKTWSKDIPYALVIDEINRGKVAQIFGELLFLLADVADTKLPIEVTTQYSRSLLSWPANLSIIGTLNNTDKSVDEVDQALRRRFSFLQLSPDYKLMEEHIVAKWMNWFGEDPAKWLKILNSNLSQVKENADCQIGHSFFFKIISCGNRRKAVALLFNVLFHEIIPTIEALTYRDPNMLKQVLSPELLKQLYSIDDNARFLPFLATPTGYNDEGVRKMNHVETAVRMLEAFSLPIQDLLNESESAKLLGEEQFDDGEIKDIFSEISKAS